MRFAWAVVVSMAALGLAAGSASAASALSLLIPGSFNGLQDLDYENFVDQGSTGHVDAGDILYGVFEVESMTYVPPAGPPAVNANFTAVFLLKVDSVETVGSDFYYHMVPGSAADWAAYVNFAPVNSNTIGILYSDTTKDFGTKYIDPTTGTVFASIATAVGTPLWEFGFTGAADEAWTARQIGADTFPAAGSISYYANVNVTNTYPAALGVALLPHDLLISDPGHANPLGWTHDLLTGSAQLQLAGDSSSLSTGVWSLGTNTTIWIHPTPEPGSLALLGLGLAAFGGIVYRRRRRQA